LGPFLTADCPAAVEDGLVRLSVHKYKEPTPSNLDDIGMHLTNYSLNKFSEDFVESDEKDTGSKRSVGWLGFDAE